MTAILGPHDVLVTYTGGPRDGLQQSRTRDAGQPMPQVELDRYDLDGVRDDDLGHKVFDYRWRTPHTGRTQPCQARAHGSDLCLGSRCPSGRPAQPAL